MSPFDHQWQRLVTLARQASPETDATMPPGFATRVVARAATLPSIGPWALFERFALRGLFVAVIFGVAAIAMNFAGSQSDSGEDYANADTVGQLLDLS